MKDLAAYLQDEVDKASIRRVATHIGIAKTTVDHIIKRKIKTLPELPTLEKIATAYGLTLPTVIRMAGAMFDDNDKFMRLAHELELSPWIRQRMGELLSLSEDEFNYAMDLTAFRRAHPQNGSTDPRSSR
jgi:transcriptional regulator with XRE-family HTH domain